MSKAIAVAITGASGCQYALRLLEQLLLADQQVQLMVSQAGQVVLKMEMGLDVPAEPKKASQWFTDRYQAKKDQLRVYGRRQWTAAPASGTNPPRAMVICPCTTGTLAAVAAGLSQELIDRAADVVLKERRQLIMVVRETPFSAIHLENMLKLTQMGAVIMPANPGFYHHPESIDDLVDFMVARILDHLNIEHELMSRWGEQE